MGKLSIWTVEDACASIVETVSLISWIVSAGCRTYTIGAVGICPSCVGAILNA